MSKEEDGFITEWTPNKILESYRAMLRKGLSEVEAGNLAAALVGLEATEKGWKPKEIAQLMFLKYLDEKKNLEFPPAYSTMD